MTWGIPNDYIAAVVLALVAAWICVWCRRQEAAVSAVVELLADDDADLLAEGMALVRNSETPIYAAVRFEHDLANLREDMAAFGGES